MADDCALAGGGLGCGIEAPCWDGGVNDIFCLMSSSTAQTREGILFETTKQKIGEAFAVVIYCTAPHVDQKSRSKWARALRFAAVNKPDDESIKTFIKRKGGINACASRYAQYVRHLGKE
jgi:hypothetical protein